MSYRTIVFVGLLALASPAPGSLALAQSPPPALELFARAPAMEDVAVSPDGARVAFVERKGDTRVVRIGAVGGQPLRSATAGNQRVSFIDWASPDHLLVVTRQQVPEINTTVGGIPKQEGNVALSLDVRTGKAVTLFGGMSNVTTLINSTPQRVLHEGRPAVVVTGLGVSERSASFAYTPFRLDPATGRGAAIDQGSLDVGRWVIRPDGEFAAKSVRGSDGAWILMARKGAAWSELLRVSASVPAPVPVGMGRDGRSVLVSGGPDGGDGLYEISPEGAWSRPLPGAKVAYSTFFDHQRDGRLLVALGDGGPYEPIIYDPELKSAYAAARKIFAGKQVRLEGWADDRRTLVLGVSDPGAPRGVYVLDLEAKRAEHLGDEQPQLSPEMLGPVREVSFAAADGTTLSGVLVTPRGASGRKLPVVVLTDIASGGDYIPGFDPWAQALASRGYAVLSIDSRDAASGRERAGDGQYGRKLVSDLADGVGHLASTGLVDPARACIVGLRSGGYAALAAVTVQTGPYRCAVAINAPADPRAELARRLEGLSAHNRFSAAAFARLLGVKGPRDASLREIDPRAHAERGKAPVLLLHGKQNLKTPLADSRQLHEALRAAGRTSELILIPDADDVLSQEAAQVRALTETVRFLQAHNPAG